MAIDPRGRSVKNTTKARAGNWLAEAAPPFRSRTLIGLVIVVAVASGLLLAVRESRRERALLLSLLAGDEKLQLQEIRITAGHKHVIVTSRAALDYLTQQFRHGQDGDWVSGARECTLSLTFVPDDVVEVIMLVSENRWGLQIDRGIEPGWPSHDVILLEPQPQQIRAMMGFLLADDPPSDTLLRIADE